MWSNDIRYLVKSVNFTNELDNATTKKYTDEFKREWIGEVHYATGEHALANIREYVMVYYNSKRLHSTLHYQTPMDFKNESTLRKMFNKS